MRKGFTLIELLITLAIIGIMVTIVTFVVQQSRESARDARRKADLENIAVGLELYRSECNSYPSSITFGGSLTGGGTPPSCTGTYISTIPQDPQYSGGSSPHYSYNRTSATNYVLCSYLEQIPIPPVPTTNCASCGSACRWRVARP
jgi:prepilin-type N-terminal cleavage/methylation domain-containing protein